MMNAKTLELLKPFWGDRQQVASFVDGTFVDGSGERITVRNAHDDSPAYSYPDADLAVVERADTAARRAREEWRALTAQARGRIIYRVGALIREEAEVLAQLESQTANKPIRDARVEVLKVAEMFEYYAGWADKLHGEVIPVPTSHLNYVTNEPLGTCL